MARELDAGAVRFDFQLATGRDIVRGIFVMKEVTRPRPVFGKADEMESRAKVQAMAHLTQLECTRFFWLSGRPI